MALLPGQSPPPALGAAPPGSGPAVAPQGNMGNAAQAQAMIAVAMKQLQMALPNIPMGSPLHADIMKAVSSISKHMKAAGGGEGQEANLLVQQLRQMQKQAPQMAALRSMAPAGEGQGPAMPPPQPAAPPMPPA